MVNLSNIWKPEANGQTVLPDRSVWIGQTLTEKAKIERFKWEILGDIQTMCKVKKWIFFYIITFSM